MLSTIQINQSTKLSSLNADIMQAVDKLITAYFSLFMVMVMLQLVAGRMRNTLKSVLVTALLYSALPPFGSVGEFCKVQNTESRLS